METMIKIMKVIVSIFLFVACCISELGIFHLFKSKMELSPSIHFPGIFSLVAIYLLCAFALTLYKLWDIRI